MTSAKADHISKAVKNLQKREYMRRLYRKLGKLLHPHQSKGLSRIDVPDERASDTISQTPPDPKTWTGPWKTLTNPRDIAIVFKVGSYDGAFHISWYWNCTRVQAVLRDKISFFHAVILSRGAQSLCNFLDRRDVRCAIKHILSVSCPKWFLYVEDFYVVLVNAVVAQY